MRTAFAHRGKSRDGRGVGRVLAFTCAIKGSATML